jgi:hypothetical protein
MDRCYQFPFRNEKIWAPSDLFVMRRQSFNRVKTFPNIFHVRLKSTRGEIWTFLLARDALNGKITIAIKSLLNHSESSLGLRAAAHLAEMTKPVVDQKFG